MKTALKLSLALLLLSFFSLSVHAQQQRRTHHHLSLTVKYDGEGLTALFLGGKGLVTSTAGIGLVSYPISDSTLLVIEDEGGKTTVLTVDCKNQTAIWWGANKTWSSGVWNKTPRGTGLMLEFDSKDDEISRWCEKHLGWWVVDLPEGMEIFVDGKHILVISENTIVVEGDMIVKF